MGVYLYEKLRWVDSGDTSEYAAVGIHELHEKNTNVLIVLFAIKSSLSP